MSNKNKAILIDFGLLLIYGVLLFCFLYFGYGHIYTKRIVGTILILISIPVCWGTVIMSCIGKNTLGHRIVDGKNAKF